MSNGLQFLVSTTAPSPFTTSTIAVTSNSVMIQLSNPGGTPTPVFDVYRNGSLYSQSNTGLSFNNTSNLTPGQTYTYFMVARNSAGQSQSNSISVTIPQTAVKPGSFSLSYGSLSSSSVTLTSTSPGGSPAPTLTIYRNGSFLASTTNSSISFADNNVVAGQTYSYYVTALNSAGGSQSNTISVTIPQAAIKPGAFSLSYGSTSSGSVTLTSIGPGGSPAPTLTIYRNGSFLASTTNSSISFPDNNVIAGQTYSYYVTAINSAGSSQSNTVSVTIPNAPVISNSDKTPPIANLVDPTNGGSVSLSTLNSRKYLDVTFTDSGGSGLNLSSITDSGAEFALGGAAASGVSVNGSPTLVSGTTYRYTFTGNFTAGSVAVSFIGGSFSDSAGNGNAATSQSFSISAPTIQTTIPQVAWGKSVSDAFKTKVSQIASILGANADYLMAAMAFESGGTFSPAIQNPSSGAVGLIQFTSATAQALGTTTASLKAMTQIQQLDYVAKYFQPYAGSLHTLADLYMAILWPRAIGKAGTYVLFSRGSIQYTQNKGLDLNGDGAVTKDEAVARVQAELTTGLQPAHFG